jgi:hypothetical protein
MCVLIVEGKHLVQQIDVENGCHAKRRERMISRESQCDGKKILHEPRDPGGGGGRKAKNGMSKNRKLQNRQNRKSEFLAFAESEGKSKNPRDRAIGFEAFACKLERRSA